MTIEKGAIQKGGFGKEFAPGMARGAQTGLWINLNPKEKENKHVEK